MTLNIDPAQSDLETGGKHGAPSRRLVQEVVNELSAWNPREFVAAFQRWHQGQVSLVHLNVLMLLSASGPMPMSRLADALDISVASVTGVVDRMEARGLVERRRDTEDRRVIMVTTAEGGDQIFAEIDQRRRQSLGILLNHLSRDELIGLLKGHRALRAARRQMAQAIRAPEKDGALARAKVALARASAKAAAKAATKGARS